MFNLLGHWIHENNFSNDGGEYVSNNMAAINKTP